jgi:hypothetical protein
MLWRGASVLWWFAVDMYCLRFREYHIGTLRSRESHAIKQACKGDASTVCTATAPRAGTMRREELLAMKGAVRCGAVVGSASLMSFSWGGERAVDEEDSALSLCRRPEEMWRWYYNNMVDCHKNLFFFRDVRNNKNTKMTRLSGTHIAYLFDSWRRRRQWQWQQRRRQHLPQRTSRDFDGDNNDGRPSKFWFISAEEQTASLSFSRWRQFWRREEAGLFLTTEPPTFVSALTATGTASLQVQAHDTRLFPSMKPSLMGW